MPASLTKTHFSPAELEVLEGELSGDGCFAIGTRWPTAKSKAQVTIARPLARRYRSFIGPCPAPQLRHEWRPVLRDRRLRCMFPEERARILALRASGLPAREIAVEAGRSVSTIVSPFYSIDHGRRNHACLDQSQS